MIQKITSQEYLKRYDNMTGAEKQSVMNRVGQWLKDKAPLLSMMAQQPQAHLLNVMQLSQGWDDNVCQGWTDGVRLLSAFTGMTDTWLPDRLYIKAVRRSINHIIEVLQSHYQPMPIVPIMPNKSNKPNKPTEPIKPTEQAEQTKHKRKRGRPRKTEQSQTPQTSQQPQAPQTDVAPNATPLALNTNLSTLDASKVIPRPQHIDQYAYLLPEETQKHAAQYGPLMRDLSTARANMALLMDDSHSTAAERSKWARVAVKLDETIASIRAELDSEWRKVVAKGNVVVDVLGMAHIVDPSTGKYNDPKPKVDLHADDKPKEDKPKRSHHKQPKLTDEEKAKRITYLQKWLRDARPANTDEHRKQWEQNARELIKLGGELTESMIKAGEHYNAKIPKKVKS